MQIGSTCIIDDDEIGVFTIKVMIERLGFSHDVITFENGEVALNYLTPIVMEGGTLPDVILLDINMPIMNGWGFLDGFSRIYTRVSKKATIYVMSSSLIPSDIEKANSYELVSGYITKPVGQDDLVKIIESFRIP